VVITLRRGRRGCITHLKKMKERFSSPREEGGEVVLLT
jgi:hypothetical protein